MTSIQTTACRVSPSGQSVAYVRPQGRLSNCLCLIHYDSGYDRSGLASALYLAVIEKKNMCAAESQLSVWFGHFSLPFLRSYAMDRTFESVASKL
jgi:hypothetical protein